MPGREVEIITCDTFEEYAGEVVQCATREPGKWPILAQSGAAFSSLANINREPFTTASHDRFKANVNGRLKTLAELANKAGPRRSVCIVAEDDEFSIAGAGYAVRTNKEVVVLGSYTEIATVWSRVSHADTVLIALSTKHISAIGCDRLLGVLREENVNDPAIPVQNEIGLLTATNCASLSRLVFRLIVNKPTAARQGLLYTTSVSTPIFSDDNFSAFRLSSHPDPLMDVLVGQPKPFVSFVGHGRSYCALGGNLCSLAMRAEAGDNTCAGDYDCVFNQWRRHPAASLQAATVFIDSCSTNNFQVAGPERTEAFNLGVHLLDGYSTAVLAPWRTNLSLPLMPYIAWQYALRGVSLGRLARRLNYIVAKHHGAREQYVLLGDPEMRPFDSQAEDLASLPIRRVDDITWTGELPVGSGIRMFKITDPEFVRRTREETMFCVAENRESEGEVILEVVPNEQDTLTSTEVIALSQNVTSGHAIQVYFTTMMPLRDEFSADVVRLLTNLQYEIRGLFKQLSGDVQRSISMAFLEITEAIHPADKLANDCWMTPASLFEYAAALQMERYLSEASDKLQRQVLSALGDYARDHELWLYSAYSNAVGIQVYSEVKTEKECPGCSAYLNCRAYTVGRFPKRKRNLYECEKCMYVCDVPEELISCYICVPEVIQKGVMVDFNVNAQLTGRAPSKAFVVTSVDTMGHPKEHFVIQPDVREVHLNPDNNEFTAHFLVSFSPHLPNHQFHLKALIAVHGTIAWAVRKVELSNHMYV